MPIVKPTSIETLATAFTTMKDFNQGLQIAGTTVKAGQTPGFVEAGTLQTRVSESAETLNTALTNISKALADIGENLAASKTLYVNTEQNNAQASERMAELIAKLGGYLTGFDPKSA
jgi:uncharacterized protein YPO0396